MGAWGKNIWESDEAVDWFASIFEGPDIDAKVESALQYSDKYGEIRAASYFLSVFGLNAYLWPGDPGKLQGHIQLALKRLGAMVDEESDSDFMRLWENDPEVVEILQKEIIALEQTLEALQKSRE